MADEWQAKLDLYLDGELTTEQMRALDTHLRGCSSCSAEVLNRVQLKRSIQSAGKRYAPSAAFRRSLDNQIATPRTRGIGWDRLVLALACVLIAVAALLVYQGRQNLNRAQLYGEVADLHVATLASSTPVDVVSSDRHTVKPWFQGKIPFTFNLPELKESELTLVGGRVAYLRQSPGAELIYQVRKHQISVFIFQESALGGGLTSESSVTKKLSFGLETWTRDGLRFIVVGDAATEDIHKLGDLIKTAQQS